MQFPGRFLAIAGGILLAGALIGPGPRPAAAQSLEDVIRHSRGEPDSLGPAEADSMALPRPKASSVVKEVALGSALAAAAGFGVGLLAEELLCDDCDASKPGGDTPGLVLGVPAGAALGVWLAGRGDPPPGRVTDTLLGALVGAGVMAGFSEMLENQGDAVRWSGVVFTGALAALGWNRSRPEVPVVRARPAEPSSSVAPEFDPRGLFAIRVRF